MSRHLFYIFFAFLFLFSGCKKESDLINSIEDLEGKNIGCQAGTTGESFLWQNFDDVKIFSFKTAYDAAFALKNKNVDAVIIDQPLAEFIVKNNKNLVMKDLGFQKEDYAIAVKKGNTELLNSINQTIDRIYQTGIYDLLINSFMPADGNIIIPEIQNPYTESKLIMGTNSAFPPFEYTNGTQVAGIDVCLGTYIANDCEKKLQIIDMSFNSLTGALDEGSIDFIAAGMTITEERKAEVDFSKPYFSSKQFIVVRK